MSKDFDSNEFRRVLGHYPTGVCAVTAMVAGAPVGMVVGSFSSASLDPPLVAFFPDRSSTTWPKIEAAGRFCVNILAEHQNNVCRALAAKAENKFAHVDYELSGSGMPIILGSVAWIDCDLHAVHEAGDHFLVLGRVNSLEAQHAYRPLLFFQGGYGHFSPFAAATDPQDHQLSR
jgi:flavin reductase (DIM6/NTAB) family NADH-FMN oxidoreductase RutF